MNEKQLAIFTKRKTIEEKIRELFTPEFFVLNKEVNKLKKELMALQETCEHSYTNGRCEYCGRKE